MNSRCALDQLLAREVYIVMAEMLYWEIVW